MRNNTLVVVMAHDGVRATVERHKGYWEKWGDVVYLCGMADPLQGCQYGLQWVYGPPQHYGYESNQKVLLGLKQALMGLPSTIVFIEYDAVILGNDASWIKKRPEDAVWCPSFRDTRPERGFTGTTFCHPPLVMSHKTASHLVAAMEKLGAGVEQGFWDRYVGLACERYGIKIRNMWDDGMCYAANPIHGGHIDAACDAVANGARFIHGIKDEQTLRRLESCVK